MNTPTHTAAPEMILLRYGELALKGGNRQRFEQVLAENVRAAAAPISKVKVQRNWGRMAIFAESRTMQVARRLQDVFGIKSVSPAWGCETDVDAIAELSRVVLAEAVAARDNSETTTFRVRTTRSDKRFALNSAELDRRVAEHVMPDHPNFKVQLKGAELELGIDVRDERAYVFVERLPGPGGLPVGTLGRTMCLLSGGIDSPVAAWLTMKRGARVSYVSFHSYPYIGEASKKKVVDLVRALARYQPKSRLHVVPFTEVQTTIRDVCPESYRTVLYRRMMQRIATRLGKRDKCGALITGESLGQVASQTLENMTCIEAASGLPVLRPLLTYDKEEAIDLARRIGTYKISSRPEPDCCTVFMPRKPMIYGKREDCERAEALMDVDDLVERALQGTERIDVDPEN